MVQHPLAFPCASRKMRLDVASCSISSTGRRPATLFRARGVLTQFARPRQPRGTPRRYLALDSSRRRGKPAQRTHLRTKRPWSQRGEPPQRFCETALQERRLLSEKLPTQNAPWLSLRRRTKDLYARTCTHVLSRVSRNGGNLRNATVSPRLFKTNREPSPRQGN